MGKRQCLSYLIQIVVTLIGIAFITFSFTLLSTEDIAKQLITGSEDIIVSQEQIESVRQELGLDKPLVVQFGHWLKNAAMGDLGFSYMAKKPVSDKIIECLPATIYLTIVSLTLMLIISVPLGTLAAVYKNTFIDYCVRILTFIGTSIPSFWMGLLLLWLFALTLGWFPIISSKVSFSTVILPAFTLAISMSAKYTRQIRSAILDELHQDYVAGAKARGMSSMHILFNEVLPNAVLPLLTILGLSMGSLLGGAAVVEIIFGWPGLGRLAVEAINYRDFKLLQGIVVWIALMYMLINISIDLLYRRFNPMLNKKSST